MATEGDRKGRGVRKFRGFGSRAWRMELPLNQMRQKWLGEQVLGLNSRGRGHLSKRWVQPCP